MSEATTWKLCSICRTALQFEQRYYLCSVSTCRRARTQLYFCSLDCFNAHLPTMRHRDAWAEEERAPSRAQAEREAQAATEAQQPARAPRGTPARQAPPARRVVGQTAEARAMSQPASGEKEVLVVVSKLKKFIKEQSDMSTSDTALPVLSEHLRQLSIAALCIAAQDGRRTVMGRDFEAALERRRG